MVPTILASIALAVSFLTIVGAVVAFPYAKALVMGALESYIDGKVSHLMVGIRDRGDRLEAGVADLKRLIDVTSLTWEAHENEVKRLGNRADHHVRRARAELAQHGVSDPELEEIGGQLQLLHGERSDAGELPAVSQEVAPVAAPKPVPESWQTITMRYKHG